LTLLLSSEVARELRISDQTLRKYRRDGQGPPFIRLTDTVHGRVRYDSTDFAEWMLLRADMEGE
tara:strand:+ start:263 stop:454 length:192 start_codon:yes stop_codon:yes gene_type:complete